MNVTSLTLCWFQRRYAFVVLLAGLFLSAPAFSQCTWYRDSDQDGFGDSGNSIASACNTIPVGYVSNDLDCNDSSPNTAEWAIVGNVASGIVNSTRIVIGPDGTPYILYRHRTDPAPTQIITVKKFTGGTWVTLGTDPISISDYMLNADMAIGTDGIPYVSFVDADMGDKVTVIRYDAAGNTWSPLGNRAFSTDPVITNGMTSIALDANNQPYVLFATTSSSMVVMKYSAGTGWEEVGSGPFANAGSTEYDLAVDKNNVPYVALADENDGELTVMRFGSIGWEFVGSRSFSDGYVNLSQIAVDANGIPYVAYYDGMTDELVVQKYDAVATAWVKVGSPVLAGTSFNFSMTLDRQGVPAVVYREDLNDKITAKRWGGANWDVIANSEFAFGLEVSIAMGPDNIPYVSCKDLVNSDFAIVRKVSPVASLPDVPLLSASSTTVCPGTTTTLTLTGSLKDASQWRWYTSSCGGTAAGTGSSVTVTPTAGTQYYVRGEGSCVTPSGACASIAIAVSPASSWSAGSVVDVRCKGAAEGSATITVTGGTAPYSYTLGTTTNTMGVFTTLLAGTHGVVVTDANSCTASAAVANVVIAEPAFGLTASVASSMDIKCRGGADGSAAISAAGGTAPYSYALGATTNTTGIFSGLSVGTYSVVVTDANHCTASPSGNVVLMDPPNFTASFSVEDVACSGGNTGAATVVVSGGVSPYTYTLGTQTNTTGNFTGLAAGNYSIGVTDVNNCTAQVAGTLIIGESGGLEVLESPLPTTLCAGNTASFVVSANGSGWTAQWQVNDGSGWVDLPNETQAQLSIPTTTAAMDGYRYRVIISSTGCDPVTSEVATLTVNTIPGAEGCPSVLLVSQGVSPNGDNELDYWVIQGIDRYPNNRVMLYNVWGDLIFEQQGYSDARCWRGESTRGATLGNGLAPDGTYYYSIDLGDNSSVLRGFVVLKR